jgi:hypothetical protein
MTKARAKIFQIEIATSGIDLLPGLTAGHFGQLDGLLRDAIAASSPSKAP